MNTHRRRLACSTAWCAFTRCADGKWSTKVNETEHLFLQCMKIHPNEPQFRSVKRLFFFESTAHCWSSWVFLEVNCRCAVRHLCITGSRPLRSYIATATWVWILARLSPSEWVEIFRLRCASRRERSRQMLCQTRLVTWPSTWHQHILTLVRSVLSSRDLVYFMARAALALSQTMHVHLCLTSMLLLPSTFLFFFPASISAKRHFIQDVSRLVSFTSKPVVPMGNSWA